MEECIDENAHVDLIDGSGYLYRAFHALPPLTRKSDGLPVGALAGFCNMLWKYLRESSHDRPTHAAVVFDAKGPVFRNKIYPEYKANRPEVPEELRVQMPLAREAVAAFGVACLELEGYEADDIIATLTRRAREAGARVTIISSDKDLMQLVGDRVRMLDPMKNRPIGPEDVLKRFGVPPEKVADVQALAGDSTDNIPGAPGIGVKTAALLINQFGDLETLLAHAEEIPQPKRRQTLIEHAEQIRLSKKLVLLDDHVPLDVSFCDLRVRDPDPDRLLDFLVRMEFRSLLRRVAERLGVEPPVIPDTAPGGAEPEAGGATPPPAPFDPDRYETVRDRAALESWAARIAERGWVAIDTETTGLDEMRAGLVGISLAVEAGEACYIPLAHRAEDGAPAGDLFDDGRLAPGQMTLAEVQEVLGPLLRDAAVIKVGHNIKFDMKVLARHGLGLECIDDTMLLSNVLNAGLHGHGLNTLSERYLGHEPIAIREMIGSGRAQKCFDCVPIDKATRYAAEDADIALRLWQLFKPQLHRRQVTRVYETEERPLLPVLRDMEMRGIRLDREALARMSAELETRMKALEQEIHRLAGEEFNVGSPAQLGRILFEKMGLPGGRQGKTGQWLTPASVLEDLAAEGNELAARVLDWRQLQKLKSTYADALVAHINPETGRVHTSYNPAGATTGRLASSDPNLQNIPVRSEIGRRIREAFMAEEGHLLLSLDYSQIELRIFAHMAGIDAMKEAFRKGLDIHAMTASEVFGIPLEKVDPETRRRAKAVNFGIIYGISAYGLSRQLRIPRAEAQAFIDRYFERFPGIRDYMDRTIARAERDGFVTTLFGRRIHTPEIRAKGPTAGMARRAAINAPIQGTAADVIRRAMVRVPEAIAGEPAHMLLQVHDELIFEVREDRVEVVAEAVRKVMERAPEPAVRLSVPLVVDAGWGRNWAEAH